MAILQGMIKIHGILERKFKASVFYVLLQKHINFWKENIIYAYHQKAETHLDEYVIPGKESEQLFKCDSHPVLAPHDYLALALATLPLN